MPIPRFDQLRLSRERARPLVLGAAGVVAILAIVVLASIITGVPQPAVSPSAPAAVSSSPAAATATPTATSTTAPTPASTIPAPVGGVVPAGTEPRAVSFIDDRTGFAVASKLGTSGGSILATQDGGKTWGMRASLDIYPAGGLTQVRFVDSNTGWLLASVLLPGNAAGCAPPSTAPNECRTVIFKTSDGGKTWREQLSVEQPSKLGPGLRALTAVDAQHAWAIRLGDPAHSVPAGFCDAFYCSRVVVATTDGEHWSDIATLPAFGEQLDFVDTRTGWVTTHTTDNGQPTITSTVLVTSDEGHSWTPELSVTQPNLGQFQVDFIDAQNGWVLLAGRQGGECGQTSVGPIVCASYALHRTSDGGRSWQKLQDSKPPTAWWSPVNNVSTLGPPRFANTELGWIPITFDGGTSSDGVLLTKDGGKTWSRVFPGGTGEKWDVLDLAVVGAAVWIVGERPDDGAWFIAIRRVGELDLFTARSAALGIGLEKPRSQGIEGCGSMAAQ